MASRVISKWFGGSEGTVNSWDRFAEEDPYLYILTSMKRTDPRVFWQSGEQTVKIELLPFVQSHDLRPLVALELGCGIGRLAFPLAHHFRQVIGVDITRGMVQRASSFANDNGIKNASFVAISSPEDLLDQTGEYSGNCDFIYSLLVFQHISEFSIIESYLHVIRTLLHKRGLAYLQFDTRRTSSVYRLKTRLPDFLLPRFFRRGIRRIRRSPGEIEASIRRAGLEIVEQLTPESEYHRYVLRLPQSKRDSR
jgi:SAM-dependent methyltransferase